MRGGWIIAFMLAGCRINTEVWQAPPSTRSAVFKTDPRAVADCLYRELLPRYDDIQRVDEKDATTSIKSSLQSWTLVVRNAAYARRFDKREESLGVFGNLTAPKPPSASEQNPNKSDPPRDAATSEVTFTSAFSGVAATVNENFVWNTVLKCVSELPER